jgi:hypothetical protein
MDFILKILNIPTAVSIIGAALAIIWNIYKYVDTKKTEINHKEFELFQKLIQNLVKPNDEKGTMFVDQQTVMLFELRHFPRYYSYSLRTVEGLYEKWKNVPNQFPRLLDEAEKTIEFLKQKVR